MYTQQHFRSPKKQPRKILGVNSQPNFGNSWPVDFSNINNNLPTPTLQSPDQLTLSLQQSINNWALSTAVGAATTSIHMERIRMASIMNQEVHAMWPYGTPTFMSPMMPPPNMALPYGLTNAMPYASMPMYPSSVGAAVGPPNGHPQYTNISSLSQTTNVRPGSSFSSVSASTATNSQSVYSQSNDPGKLNIQIGLHCMNQNAPINLISTNETSATLTKTYPYNFCSTSGDKESKASSSPSSSTTLLSSDDQNSSGSGAEGDTSISSKSPSSDDSIPDPLTQSKFNDLTRLALRGSEIAEKLAYTHRNRPCFKKIDSLCARMKQDLIRPDGVLPNINSQGIAWAVKDFIFVFTRVINAWIIIKGYVYNTPEGLNKVKAALSPNFINSFAAWQDTTMDFIENLIKSFVNLDNLVQAQKNVYQKCDNNGTHTAGNASPTTLLQPGSAFLDDTFDFLNISAEKLQQNSLNKNYLYTMVEDSEDTQRQATVNGTYFKTGTYNPIKKDPVIDHKSATDFVSSATTTTTTTQTILTGDNPIEQYYEKKIEELWPKSDLEVPATEEYTAQNEDSNWLNYDLSELQENLNKLLTDYGPKEVPQPQPPEDDLTEKLNDAADLLMSLKNADLFFNTHFTKNYFPKFVTDHQHDLTDIRSIILKCQVGDYLDVDEVIHDVLKIIYTGKEFLKLNTDKEFENSLNAFEAEFMKLLSEPPFADYQLCNIADPEENPKD